jgi:DNA-binding CsgD family transcriptional regulator
VKRTQGEDLVSATATLTSECAELLSVAAVIGPEFDIHVLACAAHQDPLACLDLLAEAQRAGVVVTGSAPERHRFVSPEIHTEVLADVSPSARVHLHAAVADAVAAVHADQIDAHLFELAGHWSAAAIGDYRPVAARWVRRAAEAALDAADYPEAARLFRRALDLGADVTAPDDRARMLLSLATAAYRCFDVTTALDAAEQCAKVAGSLGLAELQAEAALVVEPTLDPTVNLRLRSLYVAAVETLPATARSLRLWVTARLADAQHYLGDYAGAHDTCVELESLTVAGDDSADCAAMAAALHALQLDVSGPDGLDAREALADRLADLARVSRDATEDAWAHLWRVDAALERGNLGAARSELSAAYRAGTDTADVIVRWQLLRAEATLAQAQARFDDAQGLADEAAQLLAATGNPLGQLIWGAQQVCIRFHTGFDEGFAVQLGLLGDVDVTASLVAPPVKVLSEVVVLISLGRQREAAARYRALGPVSDWRGVPHSTLHTGAYGIAAAVALDEQRDLQVLRSGLERWRGHHVVASACGIAYFGPTELWLAVAAGAMEDYEQAIADLEHALLLCGANGAAGFQAQIQVELATVLARRGGSGDMRRARSLATEGLQRAELLGMVPFAQRARALLGRADAAKSDVLTTRERQVAELVADGLSNRAVAQRLYLSERTAANHVQHILDKLGLANRNQIVSWLRETGMSSE